MLWGVGRLWPAWAKLLPETVLNVLFSGQNCQGGERQHGVRYLLCHLELGHNQDLHSFGCCSCARIFSNILSQAAQRKPREWTAPRKSAQAPEKKSNDNILRKECCDSITLYDAKQGDYKAFRRELAQFVFPPYLPNCRLIFTRQPFQVSEKGKFHIFGQIYCRKNESPSKLKTWEKQSSAWWNESKRNHLLKYCVWHKFLPIIVLLLPPKG